MRIPLLGELSLNAQRDVMQFANDVQTEKPRTPDKGEYTWTQLMQASAAKVRNRVGVYNPSTISYTTLEKMGKHHQLAFGLSFIRLPIESVEWFIECEDPDVKAFLNQVIRSVWRGLIRTAMRSLEFGFSPHEVVWKESQAYRVWDADLGVDITMPAAFIYDRIKELDPQYITLEMEADRLAGFKQMSSQAVDADKAFVFTNDMRFGNLYGRPRLVYSYDPWYWSSIIVAFTNRYLERFGQPSTVAKAPPGETQTGTNPDGSPLMQNNLDLMQAAAEGLIEQSTITIPSAKEGGAEFSIEYLSDDKRGSEFEKILNKYDAWMLRGLFIPERALTQDTTVGSNSMASTHADMFLMGEESILGDVLDAINQQLIPWLLLYNFGANAPEAHVESSGFSDERKALLRELFSKMIEKGQAQPAAEELGRELGVPMAEGAAQEDVTPAAGGEPASGAKPEQPTEQQVRDAAATLSEAHGEVRRLLSERKLADAECAC